MNLSMTKYHHHFKEFWALVESYEPNYVKLNKELRNAWRLIPVWFNGKIKSENKKGARKHPYLLYVIELSFSVKKD